MTNPKVPAPKPANELEPGDYIVLADLHSDAEGIGEVVYVKTPARREGYSTTRPSVMVLVSHDDRYEPAVYHPEPATTIRLASKEQIADAKDAGHRAQIADRLYELSDLIQHHRLPVDRQVAINFSLADVAELEKVAGLLGLEVGVHGRRHDVTWPAGDYFAEPFHASWSFYADPEPEAAPADPSGLGYSREADDPTPVSPARVPAHVGHTQSLVAETDATDPHVLCAESHGSLPCPRREAVAAARRLRGVAEREPKCTPECDALHNAGAPTGLDRSWHADNCPVTVHHHAEAGETACGVSVADLPAAHGYGYGQEWDAVTCKGCLAKAPF
jgi:hypothetical protein